MCIGEIKSPFEFEKEFRSATKDMDPFDKMDYERTQRNIIRSYGTEKPNLDDKAFNALPK